MPKRHREEAAKRRSSPKPASAPEAAPVAPVEDAEPRASSSSILPFVRELREFLDGCPSTQKSQYYFGAVAALLATARLDAVEMAFMVPGHTKFESDIVCQLVAGLYNRSDCYNHGQLCEIVSKFATSHAYGGEQIMDFRRATPSLFASVSNIMSYRSFCFVADDGEVDADLVEAPFDPVLYQFADKGPVYTDKSLRAAIGNLKARSLVVVLTCLAEGKPYSGVGFAAPGNFGPPAGVDFSFRVPVCGMSYRKVRLFKRETEQDEFWVEQVGYQKTDAPADIESCLKDVVPFSTLTEEETAVFKPYYGQKAKHVQDQYKLYVQPKYVPNDYTLADGGPAGLAEGAGREVVVTAADAERTRAESEAQAQAAQEKKTKAKTTTTNVRVVLNGKVYVPPDVAGPVHAVAVLSKTKTTKRSGGAKKPKAKKKKKS